MSGGDPGQRLRLRAAVAVPVVLGLDQVAEVGALEEHPVRTTSTGATVTSPIVRGDIVDWHWGQVDSSALTWLDRTPAAE